MNKKTYIRPQLSVVVLDSTSMLASSLPTDGSETTQEQNSNALEFGSSFDDEGESFN